MLVFQNLPHPAFLHMQTFDETAQLSYSRIVAKSVLMSISVWCLLIVLVLPMRVLKALTDLTFLYSPPIKSLDNNSPATNMVTDKQAAEHN